MAAILLVGVVLMVAGLLAVSAVAAIVGALVWLVLLPFRLIFVAVKLVVLALAGGLGLALFAVTGVLIAAGLLLAVLAPLLPIAFVVFVIWLIAKSARRPARV